MNNDFPRWSLKKMPDHSHDQSQDGLSAQYKLGLHTEWHINFQIDQTILSMF